MSLDKNIINKIQDDFAYLAGHHQLYDYIEQYRNDDLILNRDSHWQLSNKDIVVDFCYEGEVHTISYCGTKYIVRWISYCGCYYTYYEDIYGEFLALLRSIYWYHNKYNSYFDNICDVSNCAYIEVIVDFNKYYFSNARILDLSYQFIYNSRVPKYVLRDIKCCNLYGIVWIFLGNETSYRVIEDIMYNYPNIKIITSCIGFVKHYRTTDCKQIDYNKAELLYWNTVKRSIKSARCNFLLNKQK